ncbi:nucleoside-diphosphate sugar epimerase [Legionella wadsworthii]|uniref:Nucleoside-diphosphate sugar epimerase n=1 Tax=Legionella wadsworthii TaxID=28088 RepID=A0A378LVN8_9GAMM|nr:TIGR01777 family oxidoreductase [Legionella wadsworthii]STY31768.1 nucleoside-diphosphate sugar epimerase [Legionella wadsworthii]
MKIIVAGGTGFLGQILVPELLKAGHEIYVIGRHEERIYKIFANTVHACTWDTLNSLDTNEFEAIINLAGKNITDHRWSSKIKEKLLRSRIDTTNQLVRWGLKAVKKPHLYNASAVGIYGLQKQLEEDEIVFNETTAPIDSPNTSFANQLVTQWEQTAKKGFEMGMPVTLMRFGVVLKRGEGMLKKLELPAQYGMGAVMGSGQQPLAWIDSDDLVNAIQFLISHPEITGPVNLVAPQYVSQKTFTKILAQVLKKPAFLWLPSWVIKLLLGKMGEELLLSGQTVVPQRLIEYQFDFQYPTLYSALNKEFGG